MKKFGLIGHPISHSKSPQIHTAAYQDLGIEAEYTAFDVSSSQLSEVISTMKKNGIDGLNVTIPHKVTVMDFLDIIDDDARAIGAVNTIVRDESKLIGRNTDANGYMESLLNALKGCSLNGMSVLVIGAGGAARAVVYALCKEHADITIANRTIRRADMLAELFAPTKMEVVSIKEAEKRIASYDVIINTSSVGMHPDVEGMPMKLSNLASHTLVSDLIYNPAETALLKEARERGNPVLNGLGMFVNQAALSIYHWTGLTANRVKMEEVVLKHL